MVDRAYIERLAQRLSDVEFELSNPRTVADQPLYRKLMGEHARLKDVQEKAANWQSLQERHDEASAILAESGADGELREIAHTDLDELSTALPEAERELMFALLPERPEDHRNTIVEIRAGTGGDEAALFAGDLYRMYSRYAEEVGWKNRLIDASPANIGGYKEIIFAIEGTDVYKTMRYESGVHRVQRIPITEASGRIHTSASTVAVLPEAEEYDEMEIPPDELRIDVYRASGAGGQHVNTTDSAVRITHIPTGIVSKSQDERSQHRNRDIAMRVLKAKLLDEKNRVQTEQYADQRRSMVGSGDRSERIRTYNFPQNRVTDHRINLTLYNLEKIIQGDLKELLEALKRHDLEKRIQAL